MQPADDRHSEWQLEGMKALHEWKVPCCPQGIARDSEWLTLEIKGERLLKASFWKFGQRLLKAHGRSLLILFLGVALPLFVFEQLAFSVWKSQAAFPWDDPILLRIHAAENPYLTQFAAIITRTSGFKGGIVLDTIAAVILLALRRWRSLVYFLITVIGSGLINRVAKELLHRTRPSLWESVSPELSFSFPSGHATTSMTLFVALLILTWGSRWRWWVVFIGSSFVITIAWTRMYLGVHYPSDILAGWFVSIAWAIGVSLIIRPQPTQPIGNETKPTSEELSQSH